MTLFYINDYTLAYYETLKYVSMGKCFKRKGGLVFR